MKCSDIPDQAIYDAINRTLDENSAKHNTEITMAIIWDIFDLFPEFPAKLVRAKLDKMVRAGKLGGCTCGCRGDFEIVGQERV